MLFCVGFLWLLCWRVEGYLDDGVDDGRVVFLVASAWGGLAPITYRLHNECLVWYYVYVGVRFLPLG